MKLLSMLLVLLAAGCQPGGEVDDHDAGNSEAGLVEASCGGDCTLACDVDEACVASSRTQPVCLHTCTTNADCPGSTTCAFVVVDPEDVGTVPPTLSDSVCVDGSLLTTCAPGVPACDLGSSVCLDSQTLLQPLAIATTCGYAKVPCANGCVTDSGDAAQATDHCQ